MKFEFDRKYNTIALYTLLVIAAGICIVMAVVKINAVGNFLSRVMGILQPFIWGFAIAYVLNPLMASIERLLCKATKGRFETAPTISCNSGRLPHQSDCYCDFFPGHNSSNWFEFNRACHANSRLVGKLTDISVESCRTV